MNIEKIKHNGNIVISDIIDNQFIKQVYIGYPLATAKKKFRQFIKNKEYK